MTDSHSTLDDEVDEEPAGDSRETCFFWESAKGKCHFEPLILGSEPCTDCPDDSIPVTSVTSVNSADGQDCQATHCPPSATQDCDWPRCAGRQP